VSTSTISDTITDPLGAAVVGARVVARLLPTPGSRIAEGTEVVGQVETVTNGSGVWSLALERNSNITPANTFYEITEYVEYGERTHRVVWNVQVGSSNQTVQQAQVLMPPAQPNMYSPTTHAHSGTYVGLLTATGVAATDTAALQAAITAAIAGGTREIRISGDFKVNASLNVLDRGVALTGFGEFRSTKIEFSGTGGLFELGTDNGHAYDANDYDGVASGFRLENLTLVPATANRLTALACGQGNYAAATYAIRDWRGGAVVLRNVQMEGWDFPFWGIQSDINGWEGVLLTNCHSGIYAGPRSDQFTMTRMEAIYNDRVLDLDRVSGARFIACQFVDNGTDTINPIRIRSAWATASHGVFFDDCWFEHLLGFASADVEAFVEIGVGDSVVSHDVVFNNPTILVNVALAGPRAKYLVKIDQGDGVSIKNPNGAFWTNLDHLVEFVGTTSPSVLVEARLVGGTVLNAQNNGAGSPCYTLLTWGSGGTAGRLSLTTGTLFGGQFNFSGGPFILGADALAGTDLRINAAAASARQVSLQTASLNRWGVRANTTAEGGSNAGSDFEVAAYNDAGAALSTPLVIRRSDGRVTIGALVAAATTVTTLGTGGLVTLADGNNVAVGTTTGSQIGTGATQKLGFFGATPVVQPANTTDLRQLLINLGLLASGGATPLSLAGGSLTVGAGVVSKTGATASFGISGDAGQTRDFSFQTAGVSRWILRTNSTAEGGSDAGSDLQILSRTDAGASKTTVLTLNRATGLMTLGGSLLTVASATGGAGFRLPHGAAPTSPTNGDMWTTTAGLFVYINGVTKTVTLT
jgi:hypothetical protein